MDKSQANFAITLLRESITNDPTKSTIISPLSISCALAMALIGARNETANQIRDVIAKDINFEEIHQHFSNLLSMIKNDAEIDIVNKLYLSEKIELLESFKNGMEKYYGSNFQRVDFINKRKEAAKIINDFVAAATKQKILNFINPKILSELTQLVIINAISFEKLWLLPFIKSGEKKEFYSSLKITKKIPFISNTDFYRYSKTNNYEMVELQYLEEKYSMVVVLPTEKFGLASLLESIDISKILNSSSDKKNGYVCIPEFKVESSFNLNEILKRIGIVDAFESGQANFSGISSNMKLLIAKVLHKAFIEVNELGTKAGAATAVECIDVAFTLSDVEPFEFLANHPFLYLIIDSFKNIYFIGTFCS